MCVNVCVHVSHMLCVCMYLRRYSITEHATIQYNIQQHNNTTTQQHNNTTTQQHNNPVLTRRHPQTTNQLRHACLLLLSPQRHFHQHLPRRRSNGHPYPPHGSVDAGGQQRCDLRHDRCLRGRRRGTRRRVGKRAPVCDTTWIKDRPPKIVAKEIVAKKYRQKIPSKKYYRKMSSKKYRQKISSTTQ